MLLQSEIILLKFFDWLNIDKGTQQDLSSSIMSQEAININSSSIVINSSYDATSTNIIFRRTCDIISLSGSIKLPSVGIDGESDVGSALVLRVQRVKQIHSEERLHLFHFRFCRFRFI